MTVIVDVVEPSATSDVGLAETVEAEAETAAGLTVTAASPAIEDVTVSVAVTVRDPAVFSVTAKALTPASAGANPVSAGSEACPSVAVKWTVPVYPVATLSCASRAVTVTLKLEPAVWALFGVSAASSGVTWARS